MSSQNAYVESRHKNTTYYGTTVQVMTRDDRCSVFKMENETGKGIMTRFPVLGGIELIYNDMHIAHVRAEQNKLPRPEVMEINHCREGRFECEFPDGRTACLGAGDLAVNMLTHPASSSWFPLSHYHGISVMVDLPTARETLRQIGTALEEMPIDPYALRDRLCGGNTCFIMRATETIQHIFSELYAVPPAVRSGYCKLKALELLLFLDSADLPGHRENRAYITRAQADTVRAIRDCLTEHLDQRITLPELSRRFGVPLTTMKQNFKTVYGDPIGAYMQSYRMQRAMWLLQTTDQSITAIEGRWAIKMQVNFLRYSGSLPGPVPQSIEKFPVRLERNLSFWSRSGVRSVLSFSMKMSWRLRLLFFEK